MGLPRGPIDMASNLLGLLQWRIQEFLKGGGGGVQDPQKGRSLEIFKLTSKKTIPLAPGSATAVGLFEWESAIETPLRISLIFHNYTCNVSNT